MIEDLHSVLNAFRLFSSFLGGYFRAFSCVCALYLPAWYKQFIFLDFSQIISLIHRLICPLSCVSPQHWSWGTPGGADLPVRGHQGRDHHPHQHGRQSRWRPRRHVQGLVRTPLQLDRQPHQLPAPAWHEYLVSVWTDGVALSASINSRDHGEFLQSSDDLYGSLQR